MRSMVLAEPKHLVFESATDPGNPPLGSVRVRILRVGICGTDLHAYLGDQPFFTYPRRLGHELAGIVEACGKGVTRVSPGDCVAVEPYISCGHCLACRRGRYNCCRHLAVLGVHVDGGMCEYLIVPEQLLFKSTSLSFDELALVETLGIGAHAVERAQLEANEWVAVVGVGPIGASVIQMAACVGSRLIAIDIDSQRLAFARRIGATYAINPLQEDPVSALLHCTEGNMPTCIFDATGNPQSMETSLSLAGHTGRVVFVGLTQTPIQFDDPSFHRRELTILATRNSAGLFPRLISLLESGVVDVRSWITHRAPLDDTSQLFSQLLDKQNFAIKGIVALD